MRDDAARLRDEAFLHDVVFQCEMDYLPYYRAASPNILHHCLNLPRWLWAMSIAKHIVICNHILGRQSLPISGLPDAGVMETQMRDSVDLDSPTSD